jgi:phosphoadenosine phosphosulfate reductase
MTCALAPLPCACEGLPDLDGVPAEDILGWAVEAFAPDLAVACSMQDAVLVDLAARVAPGIEVFFLDTGFHFQETLATADAVEARYDVDLVRLRPRPTAGGVAEYWREGIDACCYARKVAPLEAYLAGKRAWVSGLRRAESPSRAGARALEWDHQRSLVKVNPLVAWSDEDVTRYVADHDVVVNPLLSQGYGSVGCWPCTAPGEGREGRWPGTSRLECGLHA